MDEMGLQNLFSTDIGGTPFDLAIITSREFDIRPYLDIARVLLSIPIVETDSVGAGTGSFIRIKSTSGRIEIGPDSVGHRIGTSWPESGIDTPTITD